MTDGRRSFRVWACGCCHVGTDLRVAGRKSLAEAIQQTEDPRHGFEWDIAVHLGDLSGSQTPPHDDEGLEVVQQFAVSRHSREAFYNLAGNHDATRNQVWFQKWVDPLGEHTTFSHVRAGRRPYPIEGTWERYAFRVGNLLFLMMSDRNDASPPVGRLITGGEGRHGGYPAGAVTSDTFAWWRTMVEENPDSIIISLHHHMLKETTVASGPWEGLENDEAGGWRSHYHGYFPNGAPQGASYLYFVDEQSDAQCFETYLSTHAGAIDFWLGGHTHTYPDDRRGGRSHIETRWRTHFINVAALTRYHGRQAFCYPMSRLFTFREGSRDCLVQCYLHTSDYAPQGWYQPVQRRLSLSKSFHF